MSLFYIILIPLAAFTIIKRVIEIAADIKQKNSSKLKADLLFLLLTLLIIAVVVWVHENR